MLQAGDSAERNPPVTAPEKQITLLALQTALQSIYQSSGVPSFFPLPYPGRLPFLF